MKKSRMISIFGGAAVMAALFAASTASAATLVGDYQLQGTLASSGLGAALTGVGSGSNIFQSDNVMGATRQVLAFPFGSGLRMSPSVGSGDVQYSVVATFRFDDVSSYERILDTSNGTADTGFYVSGGYAYFSGPPTPWSSDNVVFAPNTYATVAISVSPPATSKVYVNGSEVLSRGGTNPVVADTLRFFKDNDSGGATDEESAGAVSCIRVYSGVLSPGEVAAIGASATCGTVASPPAATKPTTKHKCKKHKKKHRQAEAAKKCKKHKKKH